jgi:hypothetical protein
MSVLLYTFVSQKALVSMSKNAVAPVEMAKLPVVFCSTPTMMRS